MRLVLVTIFFLLLQTVFAQNSKLNAFRKADSLSSYIDESMETGIAQLPQLSFLNNIQKQLWRAPKTLPEHYSFINLLSVQGYYQLQQGDILASIASYENAYEYYKKHRLADYDIVEYVLKPLSNNYTRLGDYERALHLQHKAINFLLKTGANIENIASLYGNIAISYRSTNNFTEAKKSIAKGLKLLSPGNEISFLLNNILADILFDEAAYLNSLKLLESNFARFKKVTANNAYWQLSAYTTAGNCNRELKNLNKATQYYIKALSIIETYYKGSKLREKANILTQMGKVKLMQHQPKPAMVYFNQCLRTLNIIDTNGKIMPSNIYGENKLVEVFSELANANKQLNKLTISLHYLKLALLAGHKIRNEFADDHTKQRLQGDLKLITERAIETCYQQYTTTKQPLYLTEILALSEKSKSSTLLDQIQRNRKAITNTIKDPLFDKKLALERAIVYNEKLTLENKTVAKSIGDLKYELALTEKKINQKYPQNKVADLSISKALAALDGKNAISFFVGHHAIYSVKIINGHIDAVYKIDDARAVKIGISHFVNTYFQHGPSAMINNPRAFFDASALIYQTLLGHVNLPQHKQLIIIPDGILGYLSFDSLIASDIFTLNIPSWDFLIKQHTISYAFSLATMASNRPKNVSNSITGLFINHQNGNNQALKAVDEEAKGIAKSTNIKLILNDEVNSNSFNHAFENSNVLHIGTHAYLSGTNMEPTLDFGKEKLFLFELSAKSTIPNLVMLSACKTADGILANGEGIISFSRGFSAIGIPATVAGLWNVNDVAASVITSDFYKFLNKGNTAVEALHQAKLNWLNTPKNNDAYYLPYYWDSLIYMGTDQQIELKPAVNWWLWAGTGVAGTVLMIVVFWRLVFPSSTGNLKTLTKILRFPHTRE